MNIGGRSVVADVTYYRASRRPARQGSTLALLVDPESRTIDAFSAGPRQTLRGAETLPLEPVLRGLASSVDEVFSALG